MKPRFSFEKHQEVGKELKVIRNHLLRLSVEICNAYPKQEKVSRQSEKAYEAIDGLRNVLDNCFLEEYPDEDYRGVYYGKMEIDFRHLLASSKQKDTNQPEDSQASEALVRSRNRLPGGAKDSWKRS